MDIPKISISQLVESLVPAEAGEWIKKAFAAWWEGNKEEGNACLDRATKLYPDIEDISKLLVVLGSAWYDKGNQLMKNPESLRSYEEAIDYYNAALTVARYNADYLISSIILSSAEPWIHHHQTECLVKKAHALFFTRKTEECIECYSSLIDKIKDCLPDLVVDGAWNPEMENTPEVVDNIRNLIAALAQKSEMLYFLDRHEESDKANSEAVRYSFGPFPFSESEYIALRHKFSPDYDQYNQNLLTFPASAEKTETLRYIIKHLDSKEKEKEKEAQNMILADFRIKHLDSKKNST